MNQRGQATVELALGILIFIPVLLVGIHFAEVAVITLRVNQAANSAVWDTTGVRMHRLDTGTFFNSNQMKIAGQAPGARATTLYQNFDGLSGGGGGTMTQVFTRGSALQVTCTPAKVMLTPNAPAGRDFAPVFAAYGFTNPDDGMSCTGKGKVNAFNIPNQYMETGNGGTFHEAMLSRTNFTVCAIGRAAGGGSNCNGRLEVALDDWALSGSDDAKGDELDNCNNQCLINPTGGNQAFKKTVRRIFQTYHPSFPTPNSTIQDFIKTLFTQGPSVPQLANVPVNETDFRFDFIGEEGDLGDTPADPAPFRFMFPSHEEDATIVLTDHHWPTTPAYDEYQTAYANRGECFLGSDCGEPVFAKGTW